MKVKKGIVKQLGWFAFLYGVSLLLFFGVTCALRLVFRLGS
jgi:hypothetical protein